MILNGNYPTCDKSLYEIINVSSKREKVYLIDSYRLPIERKISSFFQNINKRVPHWKQCSINDLINIFNEKFLYKLEEYNSLKEGFDYYNIQYFDTFDFNKKYVYREHDNKVFIKLRFADIKFHTVAQG